MHAASRRASLRQLCAIIVAVATLALLPPTARVTAESPAASLPEFPVPTSPGVTARPPGSTAPPAPASAGPTSQPTAPGKESAGGSNGGSDLTPLVLAVLFVGVLIAGAVYFGLRRRPAP